MESFAPHFTDFKGRIAVKNNNKTWFLVSFYSNVKDEIVFKYSLNPSHY